MRYKDSKALNSAIEHLDLVLSDGNRTWDCECRKEHEKLYGWLLELVKLRKMVGKFEKKLEKMKIDTESPLGMVMLAMHGAKARTEYLVQHWDGLRWSDETMPSSSLKDQTNWVEHLKKQYPGHQYRLVERKILDRIIDKNQNGDNEK